MKRAGLKVVITTSLGTKPARKPPDHRKISFFAAFFYSQNFNFNFTRRVTTNNNLKHQPVKMPASKIFNFTGDIPTGEIHQG